MSFEVWLGRQGQARLARLVRVQGLEQALRIALNQERQLNDFSQKYLPSLGLGKWVASIEEVTGDDT